MTGSRTIKVLFILILAMTFGAITLKTLETKPSPLSVTELMATASAFVEEYQTDVAVKSGGWRNIVIHSTGAEPGDIVNRVHFIVNAKGAQLVNATKLWRSQQQPHHVESMAHNYNADSIAICLVGDFSQQPPSREQLQELVKLVQSLQDRCGISNDKVFMYRPDLNSGEPSPGKAFPARTFASMLES